MSKSSEWVLWFEDVDADAGGRVGGKNASIGEMIRELAPRGVRVPPGYAVTADAWWGFVDHNGLRPRLEALLALPRAQGEDLAEVGKALRALVLEAQVPPALRDAIVTSYAELARRAGTPTPSVAVRSSATAEDLPEASFAGQQETILNVVGADAVVAAVQRCFASLYTDRAISYRDANGFDQMAVGLSAGVQLMVRADLGASGILFTIDTETGFPGVVVIDAIWGLGENIVQGLVDPDQTVVFKAGLDQPGLRPILRRKLGAKQLTLVLSEDGQGTCNRETPPERAATFAISEEDALTLARWAVVIEAHSTARRGQPTPMDIEWARDGETGLLYIVQARPETVQSRRKGDTITQWTLLDKGKPLFGGTSVGDSIVVAPTSVIATPDEISRFKPGSILVADSTDPDWVPIMRQAAGIITSRGGRTCHAAIIARELGIPAIVGAGDVLTTLRDGQIVTLACRQGARGAVYDGALRFERTETPVPAPQQTRTKVMVNLADGAGASSWWRLPVDGVGLARMEFIISEEIQAHPMALLHPEQVADDAERAKLAEITRGWPDGASFFVDTLAHGIASIAAVFWPRPVVVRLSDFKSNEYAGLLGGSGFEPAEENPMIGFRGAFRYTHPRYAEGFVLECRALRKVREEIGLDNVEIMVPFCRTLAEADRVLAVMADHGLVRGERGLRVLVMCEIPSNVILAERFAERFDGFSIGSNDLTQLTLGVDRDSEILAPAFDERNEAVVALIQDVITRAHRCGATVGICGQAPSDHPGFAEMLVGFGIDSISLNPDSVIPVRGRLAQEEARLAAE